MFDYFLENVRVYDGTGLPGYTDSVAISLRAQICERLEDAFSARAKE